MAFEIIGSVVVADALAAGATEVVAGSLMAGVSEAALGGAMADGLTVASGLGGEAAAGAAGDGLFSAASNAIDEAVTAGTGNSAPIGTADWTAQEAAMGRAGLTASQIAQVAQAASKGFSMADALKLAGVAAPLIGSLISQGAIKDASAGQQQAAEQAISTITGATQQAQQGLDDSLHAGLDFGQKVYDTGVAGQNAALEQTIAGITGANAAGTLEERAAVDRARLGLAPYTEAGAGAIGSLADRLGTSGNTGAANYGDLTKKFTLADFWDDPVTQASFQTGLDTGTKALNNSAARAGSLNSGAQAKALTRFGTDYTGGQAASSQARFVGDQQNIYNRLLGVSNVGQNATNSINALDANTAADIARRGDAAANSIGGFRGSTATNIANSGNLMATNAAQLRASTGTNVANLGVGQANSIGNILTGAANARGAAAIAGSNSMSNGVTQAANWYQSQDTLDRILNRKVA